MKKRNLMTKQALILFGGMLATSSSFVSPLMTQANNTSQSTATSESFTLTNAVEGTNNEVNSDKNFWKSDGIVEQTDEIIVIKDVALEMVLRSNLSKPSGDILKSDLEQLTRLYLPRWWGELEAAVADFSDLKYMVNLESLTLMGHEIDDLSFLNSLENLKELSLEHNQIEDISSLSGLENLEILSLNNNQIEDITSLSGLENLRKLSLNNNQIKDISPLSGLENLRELSLNNNQIKDISPLSGLENLNELFLKKNQITDISSLNQLNQLLVLCVDENQILNFQLSDSFIDNLDFLSATFQDVTVIVPTGTLTMESPFVGAYTKDYMHIVQNGSNQFRLSADRSMLLFDSMVSETEFDVYFAYFNYSSSSSCYKTTNYFVSTYGDIQGYCTRATFKIKDAPILEAEDVTIEIGQDYQMLDWVTVYDSYNQNLPIEITNSTINNQLPGTYEVTYSVTNDFGLSTTKTILVHVKASNTSNPEEEVVPPTTPDEAPEDDIVPPIEESPNEGSPDIEEEVVPETPEEDLKDENESSKDEIEGDKEEDKKPTQRPTVEAGFSATIGLLGLGLLGSGIIYLRKQKK